MPIMPRGNFEPAYCLAGIVNSRANMLEVAAKTDRLTHPSAIEWQREKDEAEAALREYNALFEA